MRYNTNEQAEGKEPPSLGSGGPSLAAVGVTQGALQPATKVLPFEQQPGESIKAFAAFSLYLSMGPERSTYAVATKLAKSEQLIRRWSARWRWTDRVQAHATHMAGIEREATEALARTKSVEWGKRQQQVREEEWELHDECIQAGREALKRFHEKGRGATLGDIARILELASKLGRLASGLATDKTEVTGEDGGPVRVELEAALRKVYGQAAPAGDTATVVVDVEATPGEKLLTEGAK